MEAAQKILWEYGLGVPRLISGKDWYIEPFITQAEPPLLPDGQIHKRTKVEGPVKGGKIIRHGWDPELFAKLLADMHKIPTDWFEPHRELLQEKYPHLKQAPLGSHIWLFTTRLGWYNNYKPSWEAWQNAGFEPLSEAGKRVVTVHGDFHNGNKLVKDDGTPVAIDYEFISPQWAINDLAYIISISQFGCGTPEGRWYFAKKYLEHAGFPTTDEDIELF